MDAYFLFILCSLIAVVHVDILAQIHTACHNDAYRMKLMSYLKMTYKHAAECSKTVCLEVNYFVFDA